MSACLNTIPPRIVILGVFPFPRIVFTILENPRPTVFGAIPLGTCAPRMNDFHVKPIRVLRIPIRYDYFGNEGKVSMVGLRLFHRRGEQAEADKDSGGGGRLLLPQRGKKVGNEGNDALGFAREAQVPR